MAVIIRPHLMNRLLFACLIAAVSPLGAGVVVDTEVFGRNLGGWNARSGKAADYKISDSGYRTWKPEISPTPDGGVFVSVRIDHRRGMMATDDYASLELSFGPDGTLHSAQSSLALQGRRITSDVIRCGADVSGKAVGGVVPGADHAVRAGGDMMADLSAKLLREQIVEAGRVTFPAAIRHNFNHLYKSVRFEPEKPVVLPAGRGGPGTPGAAGEPAKTPAAAGATTKPETDKAVSPSPVKPADPPVGKPADPSAATPKPLLAPEIRPYGASPDVKLSGADGKPVKPPATTEVPAKP